MVTIVVLFGGSLVITAIILKVLWERAKAQTEAEFAAREPRDPGPPPPAPADLALSPVDCPQDADDLDIVGESFHTDTFLRLAGGDPQTTGTLETTAYLVPEPENPHDEHAVAVWLDAGPVGHLPRAEAPAWQQLTLALRARGQVLRTECYVWWGPGPEYGDGIFKGSVTLHGCGAPLELQDLEEP